ncbi:MAG: MFS transporter [Pseudomonadota bacterium]
MASNTPANFGAYLGASSLWLAGMSLQGLLFTALMVVVLDQGADVTGRARLIAELPPLLILVLGSWIGDRWDQRTTLLVLHLLVALPPLVLLTVSQFGVLSYGWVVAFSASMASLQALSDPARQSVLSRVASLDIQRAVTLTTIVTSSVGLAGFVIGSQLDDWGLARVVSAQALLFATGAVLVYRLPALPGLAPERARESLISGLGAGFRAVLDNNLIRTALGLNMLSSLFNAGAYVVALPYLINEVYDGSTGAIGTAMIVFTLGGIGSNLVLFRFMPLARPGRLFLLMQLTRTVILIGLWLQPPYEVFYALLLCWGLNMGVTTTMVRSMIQEAAPATSRSQILSLLLLSFMVSSPISALLLGELVSVAGALTALLPGIGISLVIFLLGTRLSGLWRYESPSMRRSRTAAST